MLSQSEEKLKKLIKESDAPFLGLIGESIDAGIRTDIEIAVIARPNVNSYVDYLRVFPALFAVNLTYHLMRGMGQAGHFDIYPHLQRAIGTESSFTAIEKEKLWKAFRFAILSLGFMSSPRISGSHYMADEYLLQTGVPLGYVDDLAERMISFARTVGLPDADNPEAIANWQSMLATKLGLPFSITARKAVQRDTRGYYTNTFLKVYEANGQAGASSNALERAMARAFQKQPSVGSFKRAVLPYLVNNEGVLGVFVPGGESREFELLTDGVRQIFRSGAEEKFITINDNLPNEVIVRNVTSNQANKYSLWEDAKSNRLLIFTDRGLFMARAQLGDDELFLPPGIYQFISRFEPTGIVTQELLDDPQLFTFDLTVHPNKAYAMSNGPATLSIHGEDQPFADWRGNSRVTKEGVEFFYCGLQLDLEFPSEWLNVSGRHFVLSLAASGIGEELEVPFAFDENGKATISISEAADAYGWKPGFGRIKADVFRPGEKRSLLRTSVLYWHGLKSVSRELRFDCQELPSNLQMPLCENIDKFGNALKAGNRLSRTLRLVFKLDELRNQALTWNIPGIFIEVEVPTEKGTTQRLRRQLGSVEVVSHTSPKQILVLASDPGELRIGAWTQRIDFSRISTKRLPAAFLASRITPQSNSLLYRSDVSGIDLELLRLVQPHHVDSLKANLSEGQFVVHMASPRDIEALLVRAFDVLSGEDVEVELPANRDGYISHRFGRARLMCHRGDNGGFVSFAYFDLEIWPKGAWIFRFEGKIDGNWGRLEDEAQRQYATSLVFKENDGAPSFVSGQSLSTSSAMSLWIGQVQDLSDREALQVLKRVHEVMLVYYAPDSRAQLQWLEKTWTTLLERWKGRELDAGPALLNLLGAKPIEDTQSGWLLPRLVQGALPSVLCLPADAYKDLKDGEHPLSKSLKLMSDIHEKYPALFPSPFHLAVAAGFPNFMEVAHGGQPKGFSLSYYTQALANTLAGENRFRLDEIDFRILPGDILGPLHYLFAVQELEQAYETSTATNQSVLGQTIGLASYIYRVLPNFTRDDAPDLAGLSPHISPWPNEVDEALPDEVAQRNDNLDKLARLLSWYAYYCRLEAKVPGQLDELNNKMDASGIHVKPVLTYLMQVGDALFAYYLLLWEFIIKAKCIGG